MEKGIKGKKILIVGASSGIGAQTALKLSERGSNVTLIARREEKLREVHEKLSVGDHAWYSFDVSDIDKIDSKVHEIVDKRGAFDGLVYTAGIAGDFPLHQLTYEKQRDVFVVNYFAFVEFVRQITKRGRYNKEEMSIVAVSSVASTFGSKAHTAYSSSKAAMNASVRCMAKELSRKGIRVNAIAPSWVKTDMSKDYFDEEDVGLNNDRRLERQYLGMGKPEDIANAIVFLLSDESRFITGTTLFVDGGYSAS